MIRQRFLTAGFAVAAFLIPWIAHAQSIGGNTQLAVTTSSARVQLPANTTAFPSLVITPIAGNTAQVYYQLGSSSVAAISTPGPTQSPGLPNGGICVNIGPNGYLAAIGSGSTTVFLTQMSTCPIFSGGAGSSGGGGGGSPTGPAGGDLSASYPNPNVSTFNGGTPFGTAAGVNTGTSGATIPLLNGANTFSGANAFGTPSSITLTNGTGLPVTGLSGLGTGVATALSNAAGGAGGFAVVGSTGTVTSVSVATANGVSGTVANPTTTPAITLTLGAITPSSVAIGAGSTITSSGPGGALASGAYVSTGTSGGTVPLNNGGFTQSGAATFSSTLTFSGLSAGTQVSCLGLSNVNAVVTASCGGGSSTITAGTTATSGITSGDVIGSSSNLVVDTNIAYANIAVINAANTFVSGQKIQASGATGSNSEMLFAASTSTSGAETVAILNDTGAGRANLIVNNTVGPSTNLTNMANSAVLDSTGTSSGGLYIGSTIANTNVVLFAGGTVAATNTAITISGTNQSVAFAGQITVAAMTQTAVAQSGTVCYNTSGGAITYDATLGCLTSLEEMKDIHGPITGALDEVTALKPFWFSPINRPAGSDLAEQPGFGAHQVESVDKRLVGYGANGELRGVRYMEMTALLTAAIHELKADNNNLQSEVRDLKQKIH